jgi:hypothetical protein
MSEVPKGRPDRTTKDTGVDTSGLADYLAVAADHPEAEDVHVPVDAGMLCRAILYLDTIENPSDSLRIIAAVLHRKTKDPSYTDDVLTWADDYRKGRITPPEQDASHYD